MRDSTRLIGAGYLLGFSLGGFFDGILLHQILQWHHLLSALEGGRFDDLRVQVLADGLFHLLMYFIAIAGLLMLWRARRGLFAPGAGRVLSANALIGFGTWHVVDGLISHWLLGIHRIRMDSDNPLFWDLLWFFVFGVLPLVLGVLIRPKGDSDGGGRPARARPTVAAAVLGLAVVVAAPVAALPPSDSNVVMVMFKPGVSVAAAYSAITEQNGGILWNDRKGTLFAVHFDDPAHARRLYLSGAFLVSNLRIAVGCFSWLRPQST